MTPSRRPSGLSLLAALALIGAQPAAAAIVKPGVAPSAPMREDELHALLQRALELSQSGDCAALLALLDPAPPRLTGKDRNIVQLLRIPCLGAVGRGDQVPGIYAEMIASEPDNGAVRSIGVFVSAAEGKMIEAGDRLRSLAEDHPEALRGVTSDIARGIIQELTEKGEFAARDRLFIALSRADWQPVDRPEMRDSIAQGAIDALINQKRIDDARALLPRITMPELLASMAMERHYEPLWPQIEARLGPNGGKAIDRFAAARLEAFTRSPADERTLRDAIRAFVLLGRYPEAAEISEQVKVSEGMGEDAVTSLRYHAQVLAAQGDRGKAVERMRAFAALDVEKTPSAVSGLVGLAELLDENGQAEEALSVARASLAKSRGTLSSWGAGWLRRTEVCALGMLGRRDEANRLADALIARASENEAASIEGLLCVGRANDAAGIAIATLGTAEGASRLADQFQPDEALWAPAQSRLRALWRPFLARADVRAAFEKSARILPRKLWPLRQPRAIPRQRPADEEDAIPVT